MLDQSSSPRRVVELVLPAFSDFSVRILKFALPSSFVFAWLGRNPAKVPSQPSSRQQSSWSHFTLVSLGYCPLIHASVAFLSREMPSSSVLHRRANTALGSGMDQIPFFPTLSCSRVNGVSFTERTPLSYLSVETVWSVILGTRFASTLTPNFSIRI